MNLLDKNPRVQFIQAHVIIQNYMDIGAITSMSHKMNSVAAMFALELTANYQLGSKISLPHVHHLFVVRQPDPVLNFLVANGIYNQTSAAMYYCYRLRRICEIAKRAKYGMLLTFDDIQSGAYTTPIKSFLGLKDDVSHIPAVFDHLKSANNVIKKDILEWCRDCYERHLFFLRSLPLAGVSH